MIASVADSELVAGVDGGTVPVAMPSSAARGGLLPVAVVLATRNRPRHVVGCVDSILANPGFSELIVVDQSDGTATRDVVAASTDLRIKYVPTDTRGVTSARNLGIDSSAA